MRKFNGNWWIRCSAALMLGGLALAQMPETASPEQQVRAFVAAFNARDLDALLAGADEGIEWLSIDGAKISVETQGREALRQSLSNYFQSCASCRSTLEWTRTAGSRVSAFERAEWTGSDGTPKSQSSLSVYELRQGKIARVYYFPLEKPSPPPDK